MATDEPPDAPAREATTYATFSSPPPTPPPLTGPTDSISASSRTKSRARVLAPDLLRGLLNLFMSMDHTALALHTFPHGTGVANEGDGIIVRHWNSPTAYIIRTCSHLCGPGYTFLLGMGVVYLAESESRSGWSAARLGRHVLLRWAALTGVCVILGLVNTRGQVWLLNLILFALGGAYAAVGGLWIVFRRTEPALAVVIAKKGHKSRVEDDQTVQPLLERRVRDEERMRRAETISWRIHNAILLALSVVTILWNIWFSEHGGHCPPTEAPPDEEGAGQHYHQWWRMWMWQVVDIDAHIISVFPPLAWLTFALLGMLYARLLRRQSLSRQMLVFAHGVVALAFGLVFLSTRLLQWGNLSTGCLRIEDVHVRHSDENPYLASPQAFFYITKYPPDVAFWSFTMSINVLILAVFTALPGLARMTILLDFGTSPLFYYVVHLALVFPLGGAFAEIWGEDVEATDPLNGTRKTRGIKNIGLYFVVWALLNAIMWPLCRWYGRWKRSRGVDSLWRLF